MSDLRKALEDLVAEAWDDGNATGLDGYVGPGRGAGDVDPEAVRARDRILAKAADRLAAQPAEPARKVPDLAAALRASVDAAKADYSAHPEPRPAFAACSSCGADEFTCGGCGTRVEASPEPQPVDWRQLVWAEMRHRGYTDEQIKAAERQRCATDVCEWDGNSMRWDCFDEDGKSNHPVTDELAEIAGVIDRALDPPAPQPVDREALMEVLGKHKVGAFCGTDTACQCDRTWRKNDGYRQHVADAVLALINGKDD